LSTSDILIQILFWAMVASSLTLILMLGIWLPFGSLLFDPTTDLAETGIPMILFEPKASFVAWEILMIIVSPFLQFLMTVFGGVVGRVKK
jgi:hypothetical protein